MEKGSGAGFGSFHSRRRQQATDGTEHRLRMGCLLLLRELLDYYDIIAASDSEQAVDFAREALTEGIHVFCFSHHISLVMSCS
jgi:hypothetical protein